MSSPCYFTKGTEVKTYRSHSSVLCMSIFLDPLSWHTILQVAGVLWTTTTKQNVCFRTNKCVEHYSWNICILFNSLLWIMNDLNLCLLAWSLLLHRLCWHIAMFLWALLPPKADQHNSLKSEIQFLFPHLLICACNWVRMCMIQNKWEPADKNIAL